MGGQAAADTTTTDEQGDDQPADTDAEDEAADADDEDDDEYDMSVIVDATKMPQPEDVTERDLHAVPVDDYDEDVEDGDYTINREVDFDILEQDYEDEMTATQALNEEIARAAAELVEDLKQDADDEATSELSLASVTELDVTAQLPQQDDQTAEMKRQVDPNDTAAVTVNMSTDAETTEMHVANDDETVEMDIEGGTVNTRRA